MTPHMIAAIVLFSIAAAGFAVMAVDAACAGLRGRRDVRLVRHLARRGGWTR